MAQNKNSSNLTRQKRYTTKLNASQLSTIVRSTSERCSFVQTHFRTSVYNENVKDDFKVNCYLYLMWRCLMSTRA
jgi:hypothetical protein